MSAAARLWWRLRRAGDPGHDRAPRGLDALAVLAYGVAAAALLCTLGGVHAFHVRNTTRPSDLSNLYLLLAIIAAGLLIVPIATLGGVAARLSLGRRNARLAALRLAGATSGQVGTMVLAESAYQALLGAATGTVGYALSIPVLTRISFEGRPLGADELWLGPLPLLGVVLGVVALALVSGLSSLAAVVVGPLGVARRTTPGRLRLWRVAVGATLLVAWIAGAQLLGRLGFAVTVAMLVAVVAADNLAGPVFVQLAGRAYAGLTRGAAGLIAARRIVDDPRATWRAVSALGLAICLAALSAIDAAPVDDPQAALISTDLTTGALVALVIVCAVAATSTGVVQAARVIDQREAYRDLALAGTPMAVLHRARTLEVGVPLLVTLAMGSALPLLILVPMASLGGAAVVIRVLAGLAFSVLTLLLSVQASRCLVRRYAVVACGAPPCPPAPPGRRSECEGAGSTKPHRA